MQRSRDHNCSLSTLGLLWKLNEVVSMKALVDCIKMCRYGNKLGGPFLRKPVYFLLFNSPLGSSVHLRAPVIIQLEYQRT